MLSDKYIAEVIDIGELRKRSEGVFMEAMKGHGAEPPLDERDHCKHREAGRRSGAIKDG